jgi:hypothetical protein
MQLDLKSAFIAPMPPWVFASLDHSYTAYFLNLYRFSGSPPLSSSQPTTCSWTTTLRICFFNHFLALSCPAQSTRRMPCSINTQTYGNSSRQAIGVICDVASTVPQTSPDCPPPPTTRQATLGKTNKTRLSAKPSSAPPFLTHPSGSVQ